MRSFMALVVLVSQRCCSKVEKKQQKHWSTTTTTKTFFLLFFLLLSTTFFVHLSFKHGVLAVAPKELNRYDHVVNMSKAAIRKTNHTFSIQYTTEDSTSTKNTESSTDYSNRTCDIKDKRDDSRQGQCCGCKDWCQTKYVDENVAIDYSFLVSHLIFFLYLFTVFPLQEVAMVIHTL